VVDNKVELVVVVEGIELVEYLLYKCLLIKISNSFSNQKKKDYSRNMPGGIGR
jgi:hypothetical protein